MTQLKTSVESFLIRRAAAVVREILEGLAGFLSVGCRADAVADFCHTIADKRGASPAVGEFPGYACVSVNEVAVHGVPDGRILQDGDVVTVDVPIVLDGWHADGAWTYLIGVPTPAKRRLVRGAWLATLAGLRACRAGGRIGDIGRATESAAHESGLRIVPGFTGHGIGRLLHEDPAVVFVSSQAPGDPIVPGMALTVEPVVTTGAADVVESPDGWSYRTIDDEPAAQFEQTVIVGANGITVPTLPDGVDIASAEFPPF